MRIPVTLRDGVEEIAVSRQCTHVHADGQRCVEPEEAPCHSVMRRKGLHPYQPCTMSEVIREALEAHIFLSRERYKRRSRASLNATQIDQELISAAAN
jgi:hypothetical protein